MCPQPKTFFAAERTFLSWLNLSVLLLFIAVSLLGNALSLAHHQSGSNTPTVSFGGKGGAGLATGGSGFGSPPSHRHNDTSVSGGGNNDPASVVVGEGEVALDAAGEDSGAGGLLAICGDSGAACKAGLVSRDLSQTCTEAPYSCCDAISACMYTSACMHVYTVQLSEAGLVSRALTYTQTCSQAPY